MKKDVVILTLNFPDSFLIHEVPHLSRVFSRVYILPMVEASETIELPPNVFVHRLFPNVDISQPWPLIKKHFTTIFRIFAYQLRQPGNLKAYLKYYRSFLGFLLPELEKVSPLRRFIKEHSLQNALCYDYWFVDGTLALAELRREQLIRRVIARVHGFDLYDERQFEGMVSFREYRARHIDAIFAISEHGQKYLQQKLPAPLHNKVKLSYLGVPDRNTGAEKKRFKETYTVVSCARMIPLKRIELLAATLAHTTISIRWIHFGDGPTMPAVKAAIEKIPANIVADLRGNRTNSEIIQFYNSHHIDLFISLSESEGLPVSMMEAIDFGIPIFACDTNGIGEIVTPITGHLIPVLFSAEQIAAELQETLLQIKFDRAAIRDFFLNRFEARQNFHKFTEELLKIFPSDN